MLLKKHRFENQGAEIVSYPLLADSLKIVV